MHRLRLYVDTSVIGGCLDSKFSEESLRLLDAVRSGRAARLLSPVLLRELSGAPHDVREVIANVDPQFMEEVADGEETTRLRDAYLDAKVVSSKWEDDAWHVAIATVAKADLIVSWNFKHLVNVARIQGFNSVNLRLGYQAIDIRSPQELFNDDDQTI